MELGNRLVKDHGFDTPNQSANTHSIYAVTKLIDYLNVVEEAREVLGDLGYDWPITAEHERHSKITKLRAKIEKARDNWRKEEEAALRLELDVLLRSGL